MNENAAGLACPVRPPASNKILIAELGRLALEHQHFAATIIRFDIDSVEK
jgi:hypothetical protein